MAVLEVKVSRRAELVGRLFRGASGGLEQL